MEKNIVEAGRQATDDNMAHAHCMLDTQGYKRNMHRFSAAETMVPSAHQYYVTRTLSVVL